MKEEIIKSLRWKKSNAYCAEKLGISESDYSKLKSQIRKDKKKKKKFFGNYKLNDSNVTESVNLESGEKTIAATVSTEPKSAEEIIKLLKIIYVYFYYNCLNHSQLWLNFSDQLLK